MCAIVNGLLGIIVPHCQFNFVLAVFSIFMLIRSIAKARRDVATLNKP